LYQVSELNCAHGKVIVDTAASLKMTLRNKGTSRNAALTGGKTPVSNPGDDAEASGLAWWGDKMMRGQVSV
jgi:hypothetical protein